MGVEKKPANYSGPFGGTIWSIIQDLGIINRFNEFRYIWYVRYIDVFDRFDIDILQEVCQHYMIVNIDSTLMILKLVMTWKYSSKISKMYRIYRIRR